MTPARVVAIEILTPLFSGSPSGNLNEQLETRLHSVATKDQGLVKELCYGICRHYLYLRAIARSLMQKPLKTKDGDIELLILMGLYQLEFLRIPDHAAINETVATCTVLKKPWAKGLINAVLRNFLRQREHVLATLSQNIGVSTSHPSWLVETLRQDWPEHYRAILAANNQPAPLTLRINTQKMSRNDYLHLLDQAQINASPCIFAPEGVRLEKPVSIDAIPGFFDGVCSVQDESAQLAASLLQLEAGQKVLDACAAPGGKTCHMLERQPSLQTLVALDKSQARLDKVSDNLKRLQLHATLVVADAADAATWWDGQLFDRILLDAPCSATGIIRRHPDIKWLRNAEDISILADQQLHLLQRLWSTLKPEGLLLYATCSVLKQENENLMMRFLQQEPGAKEQKISAPWGLSTAVGRQILPKPGEHDGFYYACLRKCPS